MELPHELWHKIMIMSYYLMAQNKKNKFKKIHRQLKLSFNDIYDYHIDKYIGYESMLIALDDDGVYEFDDSKFKSYQDDILLHSLDESSFSFNRHRFAAYLGITFNLGANQGDAIIEIH